MLLEILTCLCESKINLLSQEQNFSTLRWCNWNRRVWRRPQFQHLKLPPPLSSPPRCHLRISHAILANQSRRRRTSKLTTLFALLTDATRRVAVKSQQTTFGTLIISFVVQRWMLLFLFRSTGIDSVTDLLLW